LFKSCGKRIVLSVDDLVNGNKIPRFIHTGDVYREAGTARNIQFYCRGGNAFAENSGSDAAPVDLYIALLCNGRACAGTWR
jgi:hypothetical protein